MGERTDALGMNVACETDDRTESERVLDGDRSSVVTTAEFELFAAASKVTGCHGHNGCSRCHPGLDAAVTRYMREHPDVDFGDALDTYWDGAEGDGRE